MLYFENDYSEGAATEVLCALIDSNTEKLTAYGCDAYTLSAAAKIKKACKAKDSEVYLLTGGTQTNKIIISSLLRPYEGVIAAVSGHINQHEAGAIEESGHKVLALPAKDGKLSAESIEKYIEGFYKDESYDHMVFPGMVYISHPTEYGTLYSKSELAEIAAVTGKYNIPLYLDGARLGYALAAEENDVSLEDLARLCDVFYIGGTKVGALCGEAVVFKKGKAPKYFMTIVKQNGAMLAKGRILGVQFDALFTGGLYYTLGERAMERARQLKALFKEKGYSFFIDSPTNQIFVIISNEKIKELSENVKFGMWEKYDEEKSVVRFVTSWATEKEDVEALAAYL